MGLSIEAFFDKATCTASYLVGDVGTKRAAVIDPVLDFDPRSARISCTSSERILAAAKAAGYMIDWVFETHIHADHLSGASFFKERTGAGIAIGEHVATVQETFRTIFNAKDVTCDGAPFDRLLKDGERLAIGALAVDVISTPGHTPDGVSYKIGDNLFVGDTLLMPDCGTARTDFPGGNARTLYRSIERLLAYPADTVLWMCHDYMAPGRDKHAWKTTVGMQRTNNIHLRGAPSEDAFVAMRGARDKTLSPPTLILASVQVNMRAGRLPPAEDDGRIYLKLPVNRL